MWRMLKWMTLVGLYCVSGEAAGAASTGPRRLEAQVAVEETLGEQHPDVVARLENLARRHLARNQRPQALALLTRAFGLSEQRLRQEALDLSESRLTQILSRLRSEEDFLYSVWRAHPEDPAVRHLALTSVLLRKGRSAEQAANTSRAISLSLDTPERHTFQQLRELRTQLATLSHQGASSQESTELPQRLQALVSRADALETQLARHSAPLRALSTLPGPARIVEQVAAALPADSALIEFVAYEDRPVLPTPGTAPSQQRRQSRYLAFVLLPDARIRAVDLGPARALERAATAFHDALASGDTEWRRPARALYALAFHPLRHLLGPARRLFVCPDGALHLVPFDALEDGRAPLLDTFVFGYLTSGRELLARPQTPRPASAVVVFADPDFGARPVSAAGAVRAPGRSVTSQSELAERAWLPLPGTRREAEAIHQLIPQAQLLLGAEASKQRLLQLPAPGVLHLATHGFFLKDSPTPEGSRALGHFGVLSDPAASAQRLPDPLLRSGLVLSGAATPDSALVTALELTGLDLWGTELVVLSACETGLGDITRGEGVQGPRRALVSAGAETVVSSLWKVNDDTTRELMQGYYQHLLRGASRVSALHEAMRQVRRAHPHPYDWAPFISLGRDAPLRSLRSPALALEHPEAREPGPRGLWARR